MSETIKHEKKSVINWLIDETDFGIYQMVLKSKFLSMPIVDSEIEALLGARLYQKSEFDAIDNYLTIKYGKSQYLTELIRIALCR